MGTLTAIDGKSMDILMSASDEVDSDIKDLRHFLDLKTDYSDLLGQKVKVMFTKQNNVMGVYSTGENTVITVNQNVIGVDAGKIVIDGNSYAIDTDGVLVVRDGQQLDASWKAGDFKDVQSADVISLIDSDQDGKIDTAYIKTVDVQQVSYVYSNQIIAGSKTYKFADDTIPENVAKDDWVIITKDLYNDNNRITIADKATGAVNATKSATNNGTAYVQYQIGDTWYNETSSSAKDINTNVKPGVSAEYVAVNGILFYAVKTSTGADQLADVLFVAYAGKDGLSQDQARVMFPNGDKATISLKNAYVVNQEGTNIGGIRDGVFYEYSKSGNTYELIALSMEDDFYGDFTYRGEAATLAATGTMTYGGTTKNIADSADVIVWTQSGDAVEFKHITGKQLKSLIDTTKDGGPDVAIGDNNGQLSATLRGGFTSDVDGLNRASVLAVKYNSADGKLDEAFDDISANANYGFITKDAVKLANGNIKFTVWTGTENIEVTAEKSREVDFKAGTIVGYTAINTVEGTELPVMTDAVAILDNVTAGSITAVNGAATKIETNIAGAAEDLSDYSVVLYVNSKEGTGLTDGTATKANSQKIDDDTYYATNILVYGEEVLVIDVNEIAGSTYNAVNLPAAADFTGLSSVQWLNTRTNDTDEGAAYAGAVMTLSFWANTDGTLTLTNMQAIPGDSGVANGADSVTISYKAGFNEFDSLIVTGDNNVTVTVDGQMPVTGATVVDAASAAAIANAFSAGNDTVTLTGTILTNSATVPAGKTLIVNGYVGNALTVSGSGTVVLGSGATIDAAVTATNATLDLTYQGAATAVNGSSTVTAGTVKVDTINETNLNGLYAGTSTTYNGITAGTTVVADVVNEDSDGSGVTLTANTAPMNLTAGTVNGDLTIAGSQKMIVTVGKVDGAVNVTNTGNGTVVTVDGVVQTNTPSGRAATDVITGTLTLDSGFKGTVSISGGSVAGLVTVQGGTLNVASGASLDAGLTVSGGSITGKATVTGNVTVSGTATVTVGDVTGNVTNNSSGKVVTGTISGTTNGTGPIESVKKLDVVLGNLHDGKGQIQDDQLCTSYSMTIDEKNVIHISATDLKKHGTGPSGEYEGYWVGFGVPHVEGNKYLQGSGEYTGNGSDITNVATDGIQTSSGKTYYTYYWNAANTTKTGYFAVKDNNDKVTVYYVDFSDVGMVQ